VPEEPAPLRRGRGGINPEIELIKHDPALQNSPFKFPPEGGKILLF